MKLVIPLAGYGTRMRPHTWLTPKPLIEVAGKPFLAHLLDKFTGIEIDELIIIYGWLGGPIEDWIRQNYAHLNPYFVEQKEMHGQSHALWQARDHLSGPGFIVYSDTFFETDLGVVKTTGCDGIAFVKAVEDPRRFGVVKVNDQGYISRFVEKPQTMENKEVVIGLYWFRDLEWVLRAIQVQMDTGVMLNGEYFLADAFQIMVNQGARLCTQEVQMWQDTGKPETTLQSNRYLLEHGQDNSGSVRTINGVVVSPSYVAPDAQIENAIVGPYASVGPRAVIRNAVVRNSLIAAGATIEDVFLEGSLIGEKVQVKGQPTRLNIGHSSTAGIEYQVDESWQ